MVRMRSTDALNTWESAGAGPPPPRTAALHHATIVFPDGAERDQTLARLEASRLSVERLDDETPVAVDPSGNRLALAVGRTPST